MLAEGMTEPANTWHILELKISSLCHLRHANLDPPGQGWVRCPVRPTKGPYCRVGRGLLFGAFSGVILKDFNPRKLEQVRPGRIPQNSCPSHYRAAHNITICNRKHDLAQRLERKLAQATGRHTGWLSGNMRAVPSNQTLSVGGADLCSSLRLKARPGGGRQ